MLRESLLLLPTIPPSRRLLPSGGGRWLNSVIAHLPRAALANPAVTIAMADAHGTPIDLTLTPASPSQAAAVNALTASGLAATSLPGSSASRAAPLQVSSSSVLPSVARLGKHFKADLPKPDFFRQLDASADIGRWLRRIHECLFLMNYAPSIWSVVANQFLGRAPRDLWDSCNCRCH